MLEFYQNIVPLLALGVSVYVLLKPFIHRVKLSFITERQVQLLSGTVANVVKGPVKICAINVLCTIIAVGSENRWETIRFESATVKFPDKRDVVFKCRAYLDEVEGKQKNRSRSVPIALKGGESQNVTAAFQTDDRDTWVTGNYELIIEAKTSENKILHSKLMKFLILPTMLPGLASSLGTMMVPADIE